MGTPISKLSATKAVDYGAMLGGADDSDEDFGSLEEIEFDSIEVAGVPQDILDNLGRLKTAIEQELPQVRQILSMILKMLQESGDCLYLMSDEQISILYDAALGEAKAVIAPKVAAKKEATKKKANKSILDNYIKAIGTGDGINIDDL